MTDQPMSHHLQDLDGEENPYIKQKDRNWGHKMPRTVRDLPQFHVHCQETERKGSLLLIATAVGRVLSSSCSRPPGTAQGDTMRAR